MGMELTFFKALSFTNCLTALPSRGLDVLPWAVGEVAWVVGAGHVYNLCLVDSELEVLEKPGLCLIGSLLGDDWENKSGAKAEKMKIAMLF